MGKVIVSMALSVDGFSSGAGGDLSAMPFDAAFNVHNAGLVARASRVLYGATTFRGMVGYWPHQLDNPDPSEQAIARRFADGLPVTVVSDSLTAADTEPWGAQTTVVPRAQAHQAVRDLRAADGNTVVFGSHTVWGDLMSAGLVDELHLLVGPRVVAGDSPVFAGVARTDLALLDAQRVPGTDTVALRYSVSGS